MNALEYIKERTFQDESSVKPMDSLNHWRKDALKIFREKGIPNAKQEDWKYTRIANLFNKEYQFPGIRTEVSLTKADLEKYWLPGHQEANEIVFVNGHYVAHLSSIRSAQLILMPLDKAVEGAYKEIIEKHLGHSTGYLKDGINALNMALMEGGVYMHILEGLTLEHPLYIYNITDAREHNIFSQPRSLIYLDKRGELEMVETFITIGSQESFTNQVLEVVVEKDASIHYYKIQNDSSHTNQVSTTHIRQIGKSISYSVTISLDGAMVRNNTHVVLEAEHCEAHLYGLYFQKGESHIDNHTVVDNVSPNCYSNELYKGILDGNATGVFNGKIFVRALAQKTNAYQSNKNVLLSGSANVNTKPQLEIFADDVKCSHGCTVGQLDEEGMFYMQSRGIPEEMAKSLLLHGFAIDILDKINLLPIRTYVDKLISERLEL